MLVLDLSKGKIQEIPDSEIIPLLLKINHELKNEK